jgi:predicted dehydrogenase
MNRRLRMGMVGGSRDAFIGSVHRIAAQMDGRIDLVCGTFSRNRQKSVETGTELRLPAGRIYATYREMLRREAKLPADERMDFVAIVTPNNMHYPIAMAALDAGFHVVCEKPMTVSMDEARNLERKVKASGRFFCLTHNYTGYPMVKEARHLVTSGKLDRIRRVVVEYPQGWLATRLEATGHRQAAWRTDPVRSGVSCCMADIGSHAESLATYVVGDEPVEVCADLQAFVKGRLLDDDGSVLLRFSGGARGVLWASQIAVGEENGLSIRVYGEKGSLAWRQEEPNTLAVKWADRPSEIHRTGSPGLSRAATGASRLPAGHPEGYIEAFANIYRSFADALTKYHATGKIGADLDFPTVEDGLRGMAFIDAVVRSSQSAEKWVGVVK